MIACPRCGWIADVSPGREDAAWAEHIRDSFCADVEPVRGKASPHRAPLCIHGHRRDAFGICWTCATSKAAEVLRARPRHRARRR
jgi:hypothetical protein